ncbi:MAG: hypothetical protein ACLUEQ_06795 [Cloacibacillus evryensis]
MPSTLAAASSGARRSARGDSQLLNKGVTPWVPAHGSVGYLDAEAHAARLYRSWLTIRANCSTAARRSNGRHHLYAKLQEGYASQRLHLDTAIGLLRLTQKPDRG